MTISKKTITTALILLPLTVLLNSCDCLQHVTATVLDAQTKLPIDSVYALNPINDNGKYTDENGQFGLVDVSGGLCGCPPMTVKLTKNGYESKTVKIKNAAHETIYLTKKK